MSLSKATITEDQRPAGRHLIWGLRLLCGAALLVTGYLAVTALRSEQVAGCGGGVVFDCGHVLTSRWARIFGLPVSVPAVLLYGVMLGALYFCQSARSASVRQRAWDAIVAGAVAAGLAAVWFLSLQVLAIGHLCLYCMIAHTCGLAMCAAVLWWRPIGFRRTTLLASAGAAGVALMISAQLLAPPPPTYTIEEHTVEGSTEGTVEEPFSPAVFDEDGEFEPPETGVDEFEVFEPFAPGVPTGALEFRQTQRIAHASIVPLSAVREFLGGVLGFSGEGDQAASSESASTGKATPERRLVSISGGKTRLDVRQWPLYGSPEAKYVFVEMFDYTCSHCRATHQAIRSVKQRYGDDLAIVALPVPLSRACNPAVTSDSAGHADSCEIARIAVAVWRVNTKSFTHFHDWLFASSRARTAAEARQYAGQLVGEAALKEELAHPYASQYIAKHVELYRRVGAGAVPKLLFHDSTVVGEVRSTETLSGMIEREHRP